MHSLDLRHKQRKAQGFGGAGANGSSLTRNRVDLPFFLPSERASRFSTGLPTAAETALPPKYIADLLLQLYFGQLHPVMPILEETAFKSKYSAVYSLGKCPDAAFLSILLGVFATAARLLPGASKTGPASEYFEQARVIHCLAMREGAAQIEHVQCLALMSVYLGGINDMPQSWLYAGQAVRMAQDLGLHVSFPPQIENKRLLNLMVSLYTALSCPSWPRSFG